MPRSDSRPRPQDNMALKDPLGGPLDGPLHDALHGQLDCPRDGQLEGPFDGWLEGPLDGALDGPLHSPALRALVLSLIVGGTGSILLLASLL